jgi:hypothetical protein
MAFRQSTGSKFDISIDHITQALVDGKGAQSRAGALQLTEEAPNDEELEGEGFGAQYARARSALSEFSSAEPTNAAGASEKLRRDINSVLNIGGGGGALYTADRNPWGESKEDQDRAEAFDAMGEMVETSQQSLKREREELQRKREQEWANIGAEFGIKMSPGQWKRADEIISDDAKRKRHFDDLQKKNGWTDKERDEAERIAKEIIRLKHLHEQGKLSDEELRRRMGDLQTQNPTGFGHANTAITAAGRNDGVHARSEMNAESAKSGIAQTNDVQVAGVEQKAEVKALPSGAPPSAQNNEPVSFGRAQFPSAPHATNDFSAVSSPQQPSSEPAQAARPKPMQVAGFESKLQTAPGAF